MAGCVARARRKGGTVAVAVAAAMLVEGNETGMRRVYGDSLPPSGREARMCQHAHTDEERSLTRARAGMRACTEYGRIKRTIFENRIENSRAKSSVNKDISLTGD